MNIKYKENELPGKQAFFELFESTGWNEGYGLTADEIHRSLGSSWYSVSVYDGERLVGYGRILSDGKMHALITEMIVLPEYQGRGIGKRVMAMLKGICMKHEIRDIQLFSAMGKAGFYEKYGFSRRPEEGPGMEIKYEPGPAAGGAS
ncbi:MAG: GNAT family N-acetyltransferase [bacterium]|nr:GNAT family N-acetyltransferase [bacterium]